MVHTNANTHKACVCVSVMYCFRDQRPRTPSLLLAVCRAQERDMLSICVGTLHTSECVCVCGCSKMNQSDIRAHGGFMYSHYKNTHTNHTYLNTYRYMYARYMFRREQMFMVLFTRSILAARLPPLIHSTRSSRSHHNGHIKALKHAECSTYPPPHRPTASSSLAHYRMCRRASALFCTALSASWDAPANYVRVGTFRRMIYSLDIILL